MVSGRLRIKAIALSLTGIVPNQVRVMFQRSAFSDPLKIAASAPLIGGEPVGRDEESCLMLGVVTSVPQVLQLEREWDELYADCHETATVFQSHAWMRQCLLSFGEVNKPCVLTARSREGRLVAVAPLMIERSLGIPTLRWFGGSLAIYGDVLALPSVDVGAWLAHAFRELGARRLASCLHLENVRADALVAPFLREGGVVVGRQAAPILDFERTVSFADWQQGLPNGKRRSRKRRLRNLEASGAVSFEFSKGGPWARHRIGELFELKRAWAQSRSVLSRTIGDDAFQALVTELVTGRASEQCRISTLFVDEKPIAIELGFVTGGRYLSYLGAYDRAYQEFSPGTLQIERTLEACFAEGMVSFDLLPPDDAYKAEWANMSVPVVAYALPLSSLGVLQQEIVRLDLVGLAKAGIRHVPQPVRRALHAMAKRKPGRQKRAALSGRTEWSLLALALATGAIMAADF